MRSIFTLLYSRYLAAFLFFCFSGPLLHAQTHTPRTVSINAACGGYYEYLPANYNSTSGKYPLLIYISGGNGAFGNGTASSMAIILNQGVPRVINQNLLPTSFTVNGETTSFIIISPQFRYKPSPQEVNSFIDYIVSAYPRVDAERVCLTGFSIGGDVAWKTPYDLASARRLAALVPVAGYNNPYSDANAEFIAAGELPVWAIHSNDDAAPVAWTIGMVNKINSYNPVVPPVLSRPNGLTHEQTHVVVYEPTYKPNGLNIYEWCLQFRRGTVNAAPTAQAGADQSITLPVGSVTLSGAGTDPEGQAMTYHWSRVSGPSAYSIANASSAITTVSGLTEGQYVFRLEVIDAGGLTASDDVTVTVLPAPNQAPVANAGNDISVTLPQNSVAITASGSSDPDGSISLYNWVKISGPASYTISNAGSATATIGNLTQGVYGIELTVTDDKGATDKDTVMITVNAAPNQVPVANAGNDITITLPQNSVSLNGTGSSDPDGSISSYSWVKISGPSSFAISNATVASPLISNLTGGVYAMQLTVLDNSGAQSRDTVVVTVNAALNLPPVSNAGNDQTITLPVNSVTLSGASSTDADGSIAGYQWSQVSGPGASTLANAATVTATASNLISGTYYFQLLVRDNSGAEARDTVRVLVNPAASTAGRILKVNIFGGSYPAGSEWNNWNVQSNLSLTGTKYSDGSSSGITATLNLSNAVADNGSSYTVSMCPAEVGRTSSYSTVARYVVLSGLDNSKTYELEVYSARNGSGNSTRFTVNGHVINIVSSGNHTEKALFADLSPVSGQLTLAIERLNTYNYINGFMLTELGAPGEVNNQPPVSSAGADQQVQLPVNSVQLSGAASSDADGSISSYHWTRISGPASFSISDASVANPVVSALVAGTYVFELEVTDNDGAVSRDSVSVEVLAAANRPPVADAGADLTKTLPDNTAQLDGRASSDADGTIVSYQWTKISGPASFSISNAAAANPVISSLVSGTYVLQLTVTDNNSAVGRDTVVVIVNAAPNQSPVADAGVNQSINLPANTVNLTGTGSADPDGSIVAYQWKQVSGPSTATMGNASGAVASASSLVAGIYQFELLVRDNANAESRDTVSVTVNPAVLSEKIFKVNIYGGSNPANEEWNNWNVQANLTLSGTRYADGSAAPISVTMNLSNAIADNGSSYPITMCPAEVGRTTSYSTVARYITLSGLDNTKRYELEVYGSRNGTGNSTKYSVGATSINILTDRNYSNKAVFTNITPASGQIMLVVERLNTYNYINGFVLRETGSEEALMTSRTGTLPATSMTAASEDSLQLAVTAYPNPFVNSLELELNNDQTGPVVVRLVDQQGRPVRALEFTKEQRRVKKSVPVQDIPKGVYFLQVQMAGFSRSEKVVKR